ncbi:MAG: undecaprenyl-diphosphate phosphatase [Puniceicoccales bacterium]|nr:undecaprenyl-diphosphate phosphatase [Puniceicoccales bacterium]
MVKKILAILICLKCVTFCAASNYEQRYNHATAIILGITQGITEFLPISSTGHMILVDKLLNDEFGSDNLTTRSRAMNSYFTIIQCGSILAIILVFYRRILSIFAAFCGRNLEGLQLVKNLLVSLLPAIVVGLFFDGILQKLLYNPTSIACALIIGAALIFTFEKKYSHVQNFLNINELRTFSAFKIGLWQCLAMIPGTSRSMATILGGYSCKLKRQDAAEYSFLLGLATLFLATVFKLIKDHEAIFDCFTLPTFFTGIFTAFIFSILTIKIFLSFLATNGMRPFAWYRILLGILILLN